MLPIGPLRVDFAWNPHPKGDEEGFDGLWLAGEERSQLIRARGSLLERTSELLLYESRRREMAP